MTDKQKTFVNYYLGKARFNATKAARLAGFAHPNVQGAQLKAIPEIAEAIRGRLEAETISANECLHILSEQATANIRDFISPLPMGQWTFDIEDEDKPMHLVKSLAQGRSGVKIELYDAQNAAIQIGRHYKLFTDRQEIEAEISTPYDNLSDDELDARLAATERGEVKATSPE